MLSATSKAISIKLAIYTTVGQFLRYPDFENHYMAWPSCFSVSYQLATCFPPLCQTFLPNNTQQNKNSILILSAQPSTGVISGWQARYKAMYPAVLFSNFTLHSVQSTAVKQVRVDPTPRDCQAQGVDRHICINQIAGSWRV